MNVGVLQHVFNISTTASFMEARFASKKGKTFTISFHKTCGKDLNWEYFGRLCCLWKNETFQSHKNILWCIHRRSENNCCHIFYYLSQAPAENTPRWICSFVSDKFCKMTLRWKQNWFWRLNVREWAANFMSAYMLISLFQRQTTRCG